MTRHCWKCGREWTLTGQPGRSETCQRCGSDLRVCLNCASYDVRAAYQCRDRRAEPVAEKHAGNYCEYFDFARRAFVARQTENTREASAREQLKKLLGDESEPFPAIAGRAARRVGNDLELTGCG